MVFGGQKKGAKFEVIVFSLGRAIVTFGGVLERRMSIYGISLGREQILTLL